jgi:hypothetical protein
VGEPITDAAPVVDLDVDIDIDADPPVEVDVSVDADPWVDVDVAVNVEPTNDAEPSTDTEPADEGVDVGTATCAEPTDPDPSPAVTEIDDVAVTPSPNHFGVTMISTVTMLPDDFGEWENGTLTGTVVTTFGPQPISSLVDVPEPAGEPTSLVTCVPDDPPEPTPPADPTPEPQPVATAAEADDVTSDELPADEVSDSGNDDVLVGGEGRDLLFGGPGDDLLFGDTLDDGLMEMLLTGYFQNHTPGPQPAA